MATCWLKIFTTTLSLHTLDRGWPRSNFCTSFTDP